MRSEKVIGIDIGGTSTKFGVVNSLGQVLSQGAIATCMTQDPEHFVERLGHALEPLIAEHGRGEILGVGIGAPNGNFYTGQIEHAPNLKWKGIVPIAKMIAQSLGFKAQVTNDANAAAIGEMTYGAAKGMRHFIVITLGTGLGSGIVVNGEIVYGHTGFAGELGHIIVKPHGRQCGCGRQGCLETYASATGLVRSAHEKLEATSSASVMRSSSNQQEQLTSNDIARAATDGDSLALEVFNETGTILGEALADAVLFSSPQAIFLFGGLAKSGELLFAPTRKAFDKKLLNVFRGTVEILPSALPESDAAILGASALGWRR